jgi:hypothetical protein
MAASTVGTWLRSPGDGPLTVDADSTICEVHGYHKQGACYGYTHRLGDHPLLAPAPTPVRCCTPGCARARPTPPAGWSGLLTSWWPGCAAPAPVAS